MKLRRLGKLEPRYRLVLNAHREVRATTCPECRGRTLLRKMPLFIISEMIPPLVLNKSCRLCPTCDLLIVHEYELVDWINARLPPGSDRVTGEDFLVAGTVDRAAWREGVRTSQLLADGISHLHDFKEHLEMGYDPGGWRPA